MKKFLLLVFATLSIASCSNKSTIKSPNSHYHVASEQNDNKYTIRFLNDGGSVLSSEQYEFGAMPEAPDTPSKENPLEGYTYTFSGWSPSIALVTADADYVATYKAEAKTGEVIWVDGDGETLLTENYPYGSMPNYHGTIPTKTPTDTETYVFKGWSPEISLVASDSITYTAQFNSVPISTEYSIQINCTDCLVNKKKSINEKHAPLVDLTYQFNNTSKETYHYPSKLDVTVDGTPSNDYTYDNITGKLNIKLTGNTVINAVADNSCVLMKYEYSASYPTVKINCDGDFERVDWGDGTTYDATNKQHTYSFNPDIDQYDIRVFGKLNSIGTNSESITAVGIFHSVTSIGGSAFEYCRSVTSITIPNSVTSIGMRAFKDCSSLTSITIPNNITSIGGRTFYNCSSLTTFIIPENVSSIGDYAFYGCSFLTGIVIPNKVTSIGECAFGACSSLASIVVGNENTKYDSRNNCNAIIETLSNKLIIGCKDTIIPGSITSISENAFYDCYSLTHITIPNSITSIGERAFYGCSSLSDIAIPNSVISIDDYAFYYCSSLETFDLSNLDYVVDIGFGIFSSSDVPTIKVKATMLEMYITDSNWNIYSEYIEGV